MYLFLPIYIVSSSIVPAQVAFKPVGDSDVIVILSLANFWQPQPGYSDFEWVTILFITCRRSVVSASKTAQLISPSKIWTFLPR